MRALLPPWNGWPPVALALCAVLLAALQGCANDAYGSRAAGAASANAGPVSEGDESDVRRKARVRLELAQAYFEQGQHKVALEEIRSSLNHDPSYAAAYNLRGLVYLSTGEPAQADDNFQRARSLAPRDPDVFHNYGWFLCQQQRYDEAQAQFNQALAQPGYGSQARTWLAAGVCQIRQRQFGEAQRSLSRAYELDPNNPVVGYNLAQALYLAGELNRAQFYLRRLNNSELANAETLWLGMRVEKRLGNELAVEQLGNQLSKRFGQSKEFAAYEKKAFHE